MPPSPRNPAAPAYRLTYKPLIGAIAQIERTEWRPAMTSVDKLQRAVEIVRGLPTDKLHVLDRATAITVMDHVTYHDWQARAQAHGLISADVATWLYNNLGPVWMPANHGWGPGRGPPAEARGA